ncbi:uncharacterized protein LOC126737964 isoform X1 [Anthonomus grandis grandis]|uniref:uncharacterized protein LOC126737964 isoform X1 n=1 Tax=Anthonomus grandis grandis TaxID=2921223 RepID=UPI002165FC0C|nr:uncharacterized protein LOC126737964 isoform X1 [Anthonomus grandis grandis]
MAFECHICKKSFGKKSNFNRHLAEVHKLNKPSSSDSNRKLGNNRCLEQGDDDSLCGIIFSNIKSLIEHLQITHNKNFNIELNQMENMQEFTQWKIKIEAQNKCCYILKSKKSSTSGEVLHYICNRSKASYTPLFNECRKRLQKSQGSCKLEHNCTSFINMKNESGALLVEWQKEHYGHTNDLEHIRIPSHEKESITSKLISGVPPRRILETNQDRIGTDLKRIDLLTHQDIKNIDASFGVEGKDGNGSKEDAFSVELWVRECEAWDVNPVLFYKR